MRVALGGTDTAWHAGIIAAVVRAGAEVVGHAETGAALLRLVEGALPDVVVLDLAIAGDVGMDVLQERLVPPWCRYIVLRGDWPMMSVVDLERTWILDERDPRHLTEILETLRARLET